MNNITSMTFAQSLGYTSWVINLQHHNQRVNDLILIINRNGNKLQHAQSNREQINSFELHTKGVDF